jgi:methyl-accepting chemotaxis protein
LFEAVERAQAEALDVAPDEAYRTALQSAGEELAALRQAFELMARERVERNLIVEEQLRQTGERMTQDLQAVQLGSGTDPGVMTVLFHIAQARNLANRFLDDLNATDLAGARLEIEEASRLASMLEAPSMRLPEGLERFDTGLDLLAQAMSEEQSANSAFFDQRVPASMTAINAMVEVANHSKTMAMNELVAAKAAAFVQIGFVLALAVALGAAAAFVLVRSIVTPVTALTASMTNLAEGRLETEVPGVDRHDEMGAMARALFVLAENSRDRVKLEQERLVKVQEQRHRQDAIDQLVAMFGKSTAGVMQRFDKSSSSMGSTAQNMEKAADQTHAKANSVASAMVQAQQAIETIASAAQEMNASVAEIGEQATRTSQMSKSVKDRADEAGSDVGRLGEAIDQVSSIVSLINEIADQTNLLALNATIEAARAPVKQARASPWWPARSNLWPNRRAGPRMKLAMRSNPSPVSHQPPRKRWKISSPSILALDEVAETVAAAAEEQRAATDEIARSAGALADQSGQITSEIEEVNVAGAVAREASQEVRTASSSLSEEASVLSEEVRNFLDGIGDSSTRDAIAPQPVHIAAHLEVRGQRQPVTIMRISPAIVEIEGNIAMESGTRCQLTLPDHEPVFVRIAGSTERITRLQLSMERSALDAMERYLNAQHDKGKLTARERIELLLDDGSFEEFDMFVEHRCTDFGMEQTENPRRRRGHRLGHGERAHGLCVCQGLYRVRRFAVRGARPQDHQDPGHGAAEPRPDHRPVRCRRRAHPGRRGALGGYGEVFQRNVLASGVIPQISVIMGPCAGGDVYSPAMTDFIFMVKDTSYMYVTGPDVVKTVTNETVTHEDAGRRLRTRGKVRRGRQGAFENDIEALVQMRRLIDFLPASNREEMMSTAHR